MSEAVDRLEKLLDTCFLCKSSRKAATRETACSMCRKPPNYPEKAPEGQIFVCAACGKLSKSICGDWPWDESCTFNAILIWEKTKEVVEGY